MKIGTPQNTTPTVQLCCSRDTTGGRHGCHLGIGLGGPLSTARAGVHASDVYYVSSHRDRMGVVPLAADGDESGLHDRIVASLSRGQALDGIREVLLPGGLVAAAGFAVALGAGDRSTDRPLCDRVSDRSGYRRHH